MLNILERLFCFALVPLRGIEPRPDDYKSTARPSCYRGAGWIKRAYYKPNTLSGKLENRERHAITSSQTEIAYLAEAFSAPQRLPTSYVQGNPRARQRGQLKQLTVAAGNRRYRQHQG
jgi:hypothetical protein